MLAWYNKTPDKEATFESDLVLASNAATVDILAFCPASGESGSHAPLLTGHSVALDSYEYKPIDKPKNLDGLDSVELWPHNAQATCLIFYKGTNTVKYVSGKSERYYRAVGDFSIVDNDGRTLYDLMRVWYDTAEYSDMLTSDVRAQSKSFSWQEAAQNWANAYYGTQKEVTSGSIYKFTWLNVTVNPAEETTQAKRKAGEIDDNTYCFAVRWNSRRRAPTRCKAPWRATPSNARTPPRLRTPMSSTAAAPSSSGTTAAGTEQSSGPAGNAQFLKRRGYPLLFLRFFSGVREKVLEHLKDMWYDGNIPKRISREVPTMEHNPILKNPLSLDSEIPLYSQLMGIIKRSITSGALKVGDLLRVLQLLLAQAALVIHRRHFQQNKAFRQPLGGHDRMCERPSITSVTSLSVNPWPACRLSCISPIFNEK